MSVFIYLIVSLSGFIFVIHYIINTLKNWAKKKAEVAQARAVKHASQTLDATCANGRLFCDCYLFSKLRPKLGVFQEKLNDVH